MLAVRISFAVAVVLVLAGLWLVFRPHAPANAKEVIPAVAVPASIPEQQKAFDLVLRDGKVVSGPVALKVRQGEQVALRVESNANDELHLHGYEIKLRIKAGEPATLEFAASRSGRFGIELHKAHTELGALEVYPQ